MNQAKLFNALNKRIHKLDGVRLIDFTPSESLIKGVKIRFQNQWEIIATVNINETITFKAAKWQENRTFTANVIDINSAETISLIKALAIAKDINTVNKAFSNINKR